MEKSKQRMMKRRDNVSMVTTIVDSVLFGIMCLLILSLLMILLLAPNVSELSAKIVENTKEKSFFGSFVLFFGVGIVVLDLLGATGYIILAVAFGITLAVYLPCIISGIGCRKKLIKKEQINKEQINKEQINKEHYYNVDSLIKGCLNLLVIVFIIYFFRGFGWKYFILALPNLFVLEASIYSMIIGRLYGRK